jgi:DNA-binding winged helix-turn-helix (wHTH) protein
MKAAPGPQHDTDATDLLEPDLHLDASGFPCVNGRPLRLSPKERAVLGLLIERRPDVVRKDEFAAVVWKQGDMSDETLARCVSRVRSQIAVAAHEVEAVYGLGYRLQPSAQPPGRLEETHTYCRSLLQQRTPEAVAKAIALLRSTVRGGAAVLAARGGVAEGRALAVGWGQLPTLPAVAEGLQVLAQVRKGAAAAGVAAAQGALLDLAWRFEDAGRAFDAAMAAGDDDPDVLIAYSRHLLVLDRAGEAVRHLRKARRLAPHRTVVRTTLARALVQAGQGELALAEAKAALQEHPGEPFLAAYALAMEAMVRPRPALQAMARRMASGLDVPPYAWSVQAFVLARLGQAEEVTDIVEAVLLCSRTSVGEACLYAAPLAAIGRTSQAAALLQAAFDERCGLLAMVLRDPANALWLPSHPVGRRLLRAVFDGE